MTPLPSPQQLRYLIALCDQQHFGRAAEQVAVTQSTLSAGILALERQLDAPLLDRSAGKRVVFTPLGLELVARARKALDALEEVTEAAAAARAPMSGALRLGIIPTIGPFLLPRLMPALRQSFPRLRLYLREDTTDRLQARLAEGRLDVLLLALPSTSAETEQVALGRDEFFAALPSGHPLAASDTVAPQVLHGERLLLLEDGHCLRDQALEFCGYARGEQPRRDPGEPEGFAATSLFTLVQMVAGGLGVTLLPRLAGEAGLTAGTNLVLRPFSGAGGWRTLGLVWRAQAPRATDYRALVPLIRRLAAPLPAAA
jgi:LysR family hydrogen peroxide-inducible transcriptional activator